MGAMSIRYVLPVLALALLASAARGDAQTTQLIAKIPFAFGVRGQELPAGQYDVRFPNTGSGIVLIESSGTRASTFTLTSPAGGEDPAGNQAALVFTHRDNRYVLTEIWQSLTEGEDILGTGVRPHHSRAQASGEEDMFVLASAALARP
jgi:hypothetical protein